MRIGVIIVSMLVVTTPSEASQSCMSKTEARQHFGSVHIYWHGPEHCWDATPTRRRHTKIDDLQQKVDQAKWRDSMSMLPKKEPVQKEPAQSPWRWVDTEPPVIASRWVDIVQVAPPPIIRKPEPIAAPTPVVHKPEPIVTPRGVVAVIIVITLTLALVMILEGPISRRNTRSRPNRSV